MISALGTRVVVTGAAAEIHPEELEAALRGSSEPTVINLDDITNTEVRSGDSWDESTVAIESGGETVTVRFAPGDTEGPQQLCALLTGESVSVDTITGFSFVAVAVHTARLGLCGPSGPRPRHRQRGHRAIQPRTTDEGGVS